MFSIESYDYHLPEELIAQHPASEREDSKLFHYQRSSDEINHLKFCDIENILTENDLVVINNTKVVPARIYGKKDTGGKVEIFILDYVDGLNNYRDEGHFRCKCLVRASRRPKFDSYIYINESLRARVLDYSLDHAVLEFESEKDVAEEIDRAGSLPLPPYVLRDEVSKEDMTRYQTVYAKNQGAVAAPTAGLHFSVELMEKLKKKGIRFAEITLYVGYGTFSPVKCDDIRDHKIHMERFEIKKDEADIINDTIKCGGRIVAVGTTSVRTLEFAAGENGFIDKLEGNCGLFIYPGYEFKIVKAMITNFHLPKSTLIMLISAFAGIDTIKKLYETAVLEQYRFYSYGDAMFIE